MRNRTRSDAQWRAYWGEHGVSETTLLHLYMHGMWPTDYDRENRLNTDFEWWPFLLEEINNRGLLQREDVLVELMRYRMGVKL